MIDGSEESQRVSDSETLFARISHRLTRLYGIMQENRRKVDEERKELQMLVSDISHQVKTPVSNLKMVTGHAFDKACYRAGTDGLFAGAYAVRPTSWISFFKHLLRLPD